LTQKQYPIAKKRYVNSPKGKATNKRLLEKYRIDRILSKEIFEEFAPI